ncbi:N-acetyltransferase [Bacteroides fragilis]|nr:N-acetyltransferase [Bacteroides fragilis]MCS3266577.1 N-acetyltransferase [Bacteroides fragilis]
MKRRRIGYRLVEKVLANVGRQSRRLVSLCTFVVMCIQKYPGWKRLLPEGFRVN